MKSHKNANAAFKRLMNHLPSGLAETFSESQKDALRQALQRMSQGNHLIDLRLSVPFPKPGFYVVLFAGRERRSLKRLKTEQHNYPFTATNLILLIFLLSGGITLGVMKLLPKILSAAQNASFHPTAIPWLQTESECRHTGRVWRDDKCWDGEHDANF
ncbi:hypothetical protein [Egbenema bharatensis]|uniref:hypothetical protein n=1 Tax=Egbenema bharatensis TaxID=3463334 RepID=UPI003A8899B5